MTESSKESEPFYVHVNIAPVNDEPPIVAANTGLCVWEGGTFTFTTKELCKYLCIVFYNVSGRLYNLPFYIKASRLDNQERLQYDD